MSGLSQRPDVGEFRKRYAWMALTVVLLMLVLVTKLVMLQLFGHKENAAIAHENIVHRVVLATSRGIIRDRNGVILAASRESWNVYVIPARLDFEKTFLTLGDILALGPVERAALEQRLREVRAKDLAALRADPKHYKIREVIVREDVGRDVIGNLETHASELGAVNWLSVPMRYYPNKELGFHLLGYVNEVNKEDLETNAGNAGNALQAGDRVGRSGIERGWESALRGTRGFRKVILDARGNKRLSKEDVALLGNEQREQDPVPGRDVRLTIDAELVAAAKRAFAGQLSGGAVVVEVKTGRILALYSKPAVDPNDFVSGLTTKQAEGILANPLNPLIDKTIYATYPPGSTIKPFYALAALGAHAITEQTTETCEHIHVEGKTRFKCEGFHGDIKLHEAIVRSCNIFFYKLGKHTGIDTMEALADDFGFGQRTGIGLNSEVPGLMPTKAWYNQHYGGQWRLGFTLNTAIGQGNSKVTVLQLAMAYAALANGGTLYAPQVVRSIDNPALLETPASEGAEGGFAPMVRRKIALAPDHLHRVLEALHGVVNDPEGTAYKERSTKVDVAGKTGTSQVSKINSKPGIDPHAIWYFNRDHAWFAGFAPYNDPEIAVVVLVEHGGGGGHNAAPIAMRLFDDYFAKVKQSREASTTHPPSSSPTSLHKASAPPKTAVAQ
ncbi:MAG: penicillin-binding protein 2 [Polyangiales bacterium]